MWNEYENGFGTMIDDEHAVYIYMN